MLVQPVLRNAGVTHAPQLCADARCKAELRSCQPGVSARVLPCSHCVAVRGTVGETDGTSDMLDRSRDPAATLES
jgi:hypothetical protein